VQRTKDGRIGQVLGDHWDSFSGLVSKPVATVSWLSLKTKVVKGFLVWASKLTVTVW
jgi:hypothetical protein